MGLATPQIAGTYVPRVTRHVHQHPTHEQTHHAFTITPTTATSSPQTIQSQQTIRTNNYSEAHRAHTNNETLHKTPQNCTRLAVEQRLAVRVLHQHPERLHVPGHLVLPRKVGRQRQVHLRARVVVDLLREVVAWPRGQTMFCHVSRASASGRAAANSASASRVGCEPVAFPPQ